MPRVDIIGFEGLYQIDSDGNVYSYPKLGGKCYLYKMKTQKYKTGYQYVRLSKGNKPFFRKIHRLLAIHFIPNPKNEKYINHKDGNSANNILSNLEWCSRKENARYRGLTKNKKNISYKGVYKNKKRWACYMTIEGKTKYIGLYKTPEQAALAYNNKSIELYGKFAKLNEVTYVQ